MSQISNALARHEQSPANIIEQYKPDLAVVAASHVKVDTFARLAVGALRQNDKLAEAAQNNPASLMSALMTAARLGLEPGTEQFYLRPIKRRGQPEVQGIVGYQGIVELIYNAGAASSVVVEVVRANDEFNYVPGLHERPVHKVDWFNDRGDLVGAYAYAVMQGGATSKVVVLNRSHIARAKAKSDGADTEYSPWRTDEEAMWLKTAARRLGKWVPTSAERRAAVMERLDTPALPVGSPLGEVDPDEDDGPLEGELVD
ncbi:recombinase RecT [Streptomyces formicae]|uniref:Recombinase RecT n=1 Tax=Streptomyces formicae TaxID=1616117 RepID=A0ABY3WMF7_9ACTN|nr:recombinase RecT [Streptomyces formicae]UNM13818.1 recombinase RecT [Streptomyces formicae]